MSNLKEQVGRGAEREHCIASSPAFASIAFQFSERDVMIAATEEVPQQLWKSLPVLCS